MSLIEPQQLSLMPIVLEGEEDNENACVFPMSALPRMARQGQQKKSCLSPRMAGYDIEKWLIVYEYNEKEYKQFVKDWFEGFTGAVHSDADSFFGALYAQDNVEALLL